MALYIRNPIRYEAMQWDGTTTSADAIMRRIQELGGRSRYIFGSTSNNQPPVISINDTMWIKENGYVLRDDNGIFSVSSEEMFNTNYKLVE